jgi:hypothetical protein
MIDSQPLSLFDYILYILKSLHYYFNCTSFMIDSQPLSLFDLINVCMDRGHARTVGMVPYPWILSHVSRFRLR